jgi:hypothetical protein
MVKWYRQKKTPDSSTGALWKSYHHLVVDQKKLEKEMINFAL